MNFGQCGMNHADRAIAKRREEEDRIATLQKNVATAYRLGAVASWEENDIKKQIYKNKQKTAFLNDPIEKAKYKRIENINQRRIKLKNLLSNEEEQYKHEIDATLETPLQRRQRLEQRARTLRAKRLEQRKNFCEQARMKQFRDKCDELRSNHGKNLLMECDRVRKRQMQEKSLEKQLANRDHEKYLSQWRKEYQDKLDRDNRDLENKKRLNQETALELAKQIKQHELLEEKHKEEQKKLVESRIIELEKAKEEMKLLQQEKLKQLQIKKEESRLALIEYNNKKNLQILKEKNEDKEFISSVLKKEKLEKEKEALKQKGLRSDIHSYVEYLNDLKIKEKEKEKILNNLREKELEKAWQKRELQWEKEALARKQLLEQVYLEREDQIAYRNMLNNKSKNADKYGAKETIEKLKNQELKEQEKQKNRLLYNKEIQNFLKQQINDRENLKKEEKNNLLNQDKQMKLKQKEYEKLIRIEAEKDEQAIRKGLSTHHHPRQSANWWTF